MTRYDFRTLNDKDFESISADLLSLVEGKRIERFKRGRDQGIDGRFFTADTGDTIIQCKHWIDSGYAKLLAYLKRTELPKIRTLACKRYLLVTSVPLSPPQKHELKKALAPFVLTEADIYGPDDLNALLGEHPEVEKRHYRLWLSGVIPLIQTFSNAILGRSRAELETIREAAPLYVKTRDLNIALKRLENEHVLILTGSPGIGKTTLARQLALAYAQLGFTFITIEEDLSEAEAAFAEDANQFFYFDDFLGRTYLEALSPKQDSHTIGFIKRIARSKNKRLVLTSRTGILNQGIALSDLFSNLFHEQHPYELRVEHLTRIDRAHILYNHIWHSKLSAQHTEELYSEKRYHTVIRHPNFNPRLISLIVNDGRVGDISPSSYWDFVQRTLDRPDELWDHVFQNQLNQSGRDLLFLTVLNRQRVSEANLRQAFGAVPARLAQHAGQVEHDFLQAVKHASGSVLQRSIDPSSRTVSFSVFNPSVADYVERRLTEGNLWGYYLPCLRSRSALDQFQQLHKQNRLEGTQYNHALRQTVESEAARRTKKDVFTWALVRLLIKSDIEGTQYKDFLRSCLASKPAADEIDIDDYLQIMANCEPFAKLMPKSWFTELLNDILDESPLPMDEPKFVCAALETFNRLGEEVTVSRLREAILEYWSDHARDAVRDDGVLSEFDDPRDLVAARHELAQYFRNHLEDLGIDPTESEIDSLVSQIPVEDLMEDNMAAQHRSDERFEEYRERMFNERDETLAIDELFDRG